jgi:type IV pilus biogenesis protein CpaD/CtpE
MKQIFLAALVCGTLAGCAASPPETTAQQADDTTCTAQADATYEAQNANLLARTGQNGLYFPSMPNQVFDAQRMGSMSARDNQIQACEQNGNTPNVNGVPVVAPHIVQSP